MKRIVPIFLLFLVTSIISGCYIYTKEPPPPPAVIISPEGPPPLPPPPPPAPSGAVGPPRY